MVSFPENCIQELLQKYGIETTRFENSFLRNILQQRMVELNLVDADSYLDYLKMKASEIEILRLLLNNSYSEFFRDPLSYAVLEKLVLPALIAEKKQQGKELRIWSVACASGQEPCSLAMLIEENTPPTEKNTRYRIFATDKSELQIEQAVKGQYTSMTLGKVSLMRLNKWFDKTQGQDDDAQYVVKSSLKRNIDFSVFDLIANHAGAPPASIYGSFDLVVCANFLFYYKPYWRKLILEKVIHAITPNGLIMVGEAERELLNQQGVTEVFYRSGIFRV